MFAPKILNLAFYQFHPLTPEHLNQGSRAAVRALCKSAGFRGTIILAPEGINGFLAGDAAQADQLGRELGDWWARLGGAPLDFKRSVSERIPFKRLKIKVKREIIPLGFQLHTDRPQGTRIAPENLDAFVAAHPDTLFVDTRNTYEIARGVFRNALTYPLESFREFPAVLADVAKHAAGRPIVMYCTGGIRCEKATALALDRGLTNVYQIEGGILRYLERRGGSTPSLFDGQCFVFDEREALDADLRAAPA